MQGTRPFGVNTNRDFYFAEKDNDIKSKNVGEIPSHLKSPFNGYLYPHNYPNAIVKQTYLPKNIENAKYYVPKDNSKYEKALKEVYEKIEQLKQ